MADKRLIVHPDQLDAVIKDAQAKGYKVTFGPQNAGEFLDGLRAGAEERWEATKLRFVPFDGATGEMWDDCLGAYLLGLDIAAVSMALAIIEGLLRAGIYDACSSPSTPEGAVDTVMEDRLKSMTLMPLTEKARKLGLISNEDEAFIKAKVVPLRNPVQHGNAQQLVRDLLGDNFELPVEQLDLVAGGEPQPTKVKMADAKWITGSVVRSVCESVAPEALTLCCMMSRHLDRTIRDIPKERLPLPW